MVFIKHLARAYVCRITFLPDPNNLRLNRSLNDHYASLQTSAMGRLQPFVTVCDYWSTGTCHTRINLLSVLCGELIYESNPKISN